jgi:hypothetical protein
MPINLVYGVGQAKIHVDDLTRWRLKSMTKTIDYFTLDVRQGLGNEYLASYSGKYTLRFFGNLIPEPCSALLLMAGAALCGGRLRQSRRLD